MCIGSVIINTTNVAVGNFVSMITVLCELTKSQTASAVSCVFWRVFIGGSWDQTRYEPSSTDELYDNSLLILHDNHCSGVWFTLVVRLSVIRPSIFLFKRVLSNILCFDTIGESCFEITGGISQVIIFSCHPSSMLYAVWETSWIFIDR